MRIVIEAKEATSFGGGGEIGELFEFSVATESADIFRQSASVFLSEPIHARTITL